MLRRGKTHDTMLITDYTQMFLAEAAPVASVSPCRKRVGLTRNPDHGSVLAGGRAR